MSITRRSFLATTAAAGAGLAATAVQAAEAKSPAAKSTASSTGASGAKAAAPAKDSAKEASKPAGVAAKKYTTALIGCGWWGMNVLRTAIASGQVKAAAICDVDRRQIDPASAEIEKLTGDAPKEYKDYRELLDEVKPEIVIVATPDHWHPLITIAAVKRGAHVYVEKPISHTIAEGVAMVKAAREADRVVQVGFHRRVSPHNMSAIQFLQSGKLGKIGLVRAFVASGQRPADPVTAEQPPDELDWNLWCGPAPLRPYTKAIHPKGFRRYLDFANGQLGDWGVHWLDQILWWSGERFPKRVYSSGGRRVMVDGSDAPDTQLVTYEFDSFNVQWEHRLYGGSESEKHSVGCYFYGVEGTLHLGWLDGWTFYPTKKSGKLIHETPTLHEPDHQNIAELWADFLQAIAAKKRPVADILTGHYATNMALLGMLSLKLGRSIDWDGNRAQVIGDLEANRLLRRAYRSPWEYPEA